MNPNENALNPLVLMYHGVDPGDGRYDYAEAGMRSYILKREDFAAHLEAIERSGRPVIDPSAFIEGGPNPPCEPGSILLTFDDGDLSDYDIVTPLLCERGWKALFFITTGTVGIDGQVLSDQLREMADAGMVPGAHGHSHRFLSSMGQEDQLQELDYSRSMLLDMTGQKPRSLSLPGGRYNSATLTLAKECGLEVVFTSKPAGEESIQGIRVVGRVAVRASWTGEFLSDLLAHQNKHIRNMRRLDLLRRTAQRCLGNHLYPLLHKALWATRSR